MAVYSVPPHIILGSHTSMCALHGLCMRFFWCVGLQLKEVAEYLTAPPRSLRRVALMIGRASGVKVPWSLASELPRVFSRTWGAWSRLKLEEAARGAAG